MTRVCPHCFTEPTLKRRIKEIRPNFPNQRCTFHAPYKGVPIKVVAEIVDPVFRNLYGIGDCCLAAHSGHGEARWILGRNLHRPGAPGFHTRNLVQAYVWYSLALDAGYSDAAKGKEKVLRDMTPAQIAEAERLVAEWQPNPAECEALAGQVNN